MLTTLARILAPAHKKHYAVGAFNINNLEILQAVLRAAQHLHAPVILQTSQGALAYAGIDFLPPLALSAAEKTPVPVVLHLDHGTDLHIIRTCIKTGYTSVMIDGSHHPFKKNVALTKKVVSWAHRKGVSVEGELGTIGGAEDTTRSRTILSTDPDTAAVFVEQTGIDALAIAIGTSHGAYKFSGKPHLDIKRLAAIQKKVTIPLVLHGASQVPPTTVAQAKRYGARLGHPEGVPPAHIRAAITHGITKINIDTDLRLAFTAAIRKVLHTQPHEFDPRHILQPARDLMQQTVEHHIKLFGSAKKA